MGTYVMSIVNKILKEAEITNHFEERLHQRFLDKPSFYVGYDLGRNQYQKLGRFSIPDADIQTIKDDIAFLQSLNFNPQKSYAIRLYKLKIDKSKVDYFDEESKADANGRALIIIDDEHTNGDVVYAVVGSNKLLSIYVVKSYQEHQFHTDIKTNLETIKSHVSSKNKVLV